MDAWNKGLGDFDAETAFRGMKQDYEKTHLNNLSDKLEKAYHAYFAMKMAAGLPDRFTRFPGTDPAPG